MIKSSLKFLLSAALLITVGCSKDDDAPAPEANPPFVGKPLPDNCTSTLNVDIFWGEDPKAERYKINVGYKPGGAGHSMHDFGAPKEHYPLVLERGDHYHFTMTRTQGFNRTSTRVADVFIPTCENRELYKAGNPNYEEPAVIEVIW